MAKFGRNYKLRIQDSDFEWVEIKLPFTLQFDIHRNIILSTNFSFTIIYNLPVEIRERIQKDQWTLGNPRLMQLSVGYEDDPPLVATGSLSRVWSRRNGVDFLTTINAYDYGFGIQQATSNFTVVRGTPRQEVVTRLVNDLKRKGLSIGGVDSFEGRLIRGASFTGNSFFQLTQFLRPFGGKAWVDNGHLYATKETTSINSDIIINADTGLLSTPIFEKLYIEFDLLFEPRLHVGQIVTLQSVSTPRANGKYTVNRLTHRGTISPVQGGEMVTSVELFAAAAEKLITRGSIT